MGIKAPMRAGTVIGLQALATVVEVSESVDTDGDESRLRLDLQLTDLELKAGGQVDAGKLYGAS